MPIASCMFSQCGPFFQVTIAEFHLEIWPGYSTTIRQHEAQILMCANIESKVMRTDTCLHLLQDCARSSPSDYKVCIQSVISEGVHNF